ncbi:RNA polymerase sigma factor [soil metagenome]
MTDSESRAGDFKRHVEPEIEVLLRVARTLTGSWADAEDLVQETLVRAFRAIDRFDGRYPRAWLLTILRNTNANMHRRQRPDLFDGGDVPEGQRPAFGAAPPATVEDEALYGRLEAGLEAALRDLDPRFRQVVVLVDIDQLSYAEAARTLGVPVGTVMSRLHRARNRLRKALLVQPPEGSPS